MRRPIHAFRFLNGFSRSLAVGVLSLATAGLVAGEARADPPTRIASRIGDANEGVPANSLQSAIRLARSSQESLQSVKDYEARFIKRELIGGRLHTQSMQIKVRQEPFAVYLKFLEPKAGREVIYADGRNGGRLLVHEVGLKSVVGVVSLLPNSPEVMAENRHPINEIGITTMLDLILQQWERESKLETVQVTYYPDAKIGSLECRVIETQHPTPHRDVIFHRTRLFLDRQTNLPIRVQQYGFPSQPGAEPPLIEEYTYLDLKTNVGLKELDFDTRNPDYNF